MTDDTVTLRAETFDALVCLAQETGSTPEQLLDQACRQALSNAAMAGFEASLREHSDFYGELAR
jgi:GH15 family glucan-1,4-alpha-glucosidase